MTNQAGENQRDREASPAAPLVPIVKMAAAAAGMQIAEFLNAIAEDCKTADGTPSDPARKVILRYEDAVRRNDGHVGCRFRVADLIRSYLHKRRKGLQTRPKFVLACRLCEQALVLLRERRYGPVLPKDPGSVQKMEAVCGAYAVCRRDTAKGPRRELLVLAHEGRGGGRTYAFLISPEVVVRGRFTIMGRTIWCRMTGHRDKSQLDMLNLFMPEPESAANQHVLAGVLIGLSTDDTLPANMPFLAVKIEGGEKGRLMMVGDQADAVLREGFKVAVATDRSGVIETLAQEVLKLDPVIRPQLARQARERMENGDDLIGDGMRRFLREAESLLKRGQSVRKPKQGMRRGQK